MERIAPLAKILAEANGIEWQTLPGTGAGGQIVEQDILDYLSRVMSGEAEPPSTPVDAPPPDWNGEDIPGGGMFDASALSKAGVESDIAEFVSQGRPAGPQVPGTGAAALATDDFELDDAPEPDLLAPPAAAAPVAPAPAVTAKVAETVAEVAAPAAVAGGLGSLLSRLYHKDEEPAAAVQPAPTPAPEAAPVTEVAAPVVSAPEVAAPVVHAAPEAAAAPEVRADDRIAVPVAPVATQAPAPEAAAPVAPAPVVEAPAAEKAPAPASPEVAAPEVAAPVTPEVPRDAVWFGTYLRRNADVSSLSDLRGQLSEALERDVPLALLVARAAQRHAESLGLSSVAVQDVHAAVARPVQGGGVREALGGLEHTFEDKPDLLVVDAGTLDLDDLHYPHTLTLSVGRVEGGKASLSLQGDVDHAKAAQFLASVAQTLEKPVILIV